jgi:NADH-quinone oxidoreductase subunit M
MGLPGTSNFIGELIIFISAYRTNGLVFVFLVSSVLLVSIFSLLVLVRVIFYQVTGFLVPTKMNDLSFTELSIASVLVVYIILFGIFPNLLISLLDSVL